MAEKAVKFPQELGSTKELLSGARLTALKSMLLIILRSNTKPTNDELYKLIAIM